MNPVSAIFATILGLGVLSLPVSAYLAYSEAHAPEGEKLAYSRVVDDEVRECLETRGAWRCYEDVLYEDATHRVRYGSTSRVERLARMVDVKEMLAFCDYGSKVDCANRIVGHGYTREQVSSVLLAGG
ncbi:hypothetical protein [Rhizobium leguminosarum]|jgi:hypothetical protein|uniref:hypothetical protein n=1 Tax=Rhizobium leguminosarum TaxID=384 RepID=UPI002E1496DB|nr:hypothetical protein U8Q02_39585 [Rhizobium leguminosarum]